MNEQNKEVVQLLENIALAVENKTLNVLQIPVDNMGQIIKGVFHNDEVTHMYHDKIDSAIHSGNVQEVVRLLKILAERIREVDRQNDTLQSQNREYCKAVYQKRYGTGNNIEKDSTLFTGKGVIYTAITGGYDTVQPPLYQEAGVDYLLFTDNPDTAAAGWQVKQITVEEGLSPAKQARKVKILAHEYVSQYDYSVWVDGKLQIIGDLGEYIRKYRNTSPMICFNHYSRDCCYEEGEACIRQKKEVPDVVYLQLETYKKAGYPQHNGLIESGIIVREHNNPLVKKVMQTWWEEVYNKSQRDQLSFNYACWKHGFMYDCSDLLIYDEQYVKLFSHVEKTGKV